MILDRAETALMPHGLATQDQREITKACSPVQDVEVAVSRWETAAYWHAGRGEGPSFVKQARS